MDCDGDVDLWTGESGSVAPNYSNMYMNDGFGYFVAEPLRFPRLFNETSLLEDGTLGNYYGLAGSFCDLDRDGDNDLYFGGEIGSGAVPQDFVMVNNGFGYFRIAPAVLPLSPPEQGGPRTVDVTCRDLNLDGWPDLILGRDQSLFVWYNRGGLNFEDVTSQLFGSNPGTGLDWQVTDMNGDGWPDIYRAGGSGGHFFINNAGTAFTAIDAPSGPPGELIDANGDGKMDFVVVDLATTPALWLNTQP